MDAPGRGWQAVPSARDEVNDDIFVVRKLGVPGREELAMGAIASGACGVARWCPSFGTGPTDEAIARKLVRTGALFVTRASRQVCLVPSSRVNQPFR